MAFIPVNGANLTVALQNDVQQWRTTLDWAQDRQYAYSQQLTTNIMTNLSIATADQNMILAFIADLNNFNLLAAGQAHTTGSIFRFNIAGILGVL